MLISAFLPRFIPKIYPKCSVMLPSVCRALMELSGHCCRLFFCQVMCDNHLLPFKPAAIARRTQGSGQALGAASQGATGTSAALTGKHTKLGSGSSRTF